MAGSLGISDHNWAPKMSYPIHDHFGALPLSPPFLEIDGVD